MKAGFAGKLRLKTKLVAGFLLVLILMALVGVTGFTSMKRISAMSESIYDDRLIPITYLAAVRADSLKVRENVLRHVMEADLAKKQTYQDNIDKFEADLQKNLKEYSAHDLSEEEKTALEGYTKAWSTYTDGRNQTLSFSAKGDAEGAKASASRVGKLFDEAMAAVDTLMEVNMKTANKLHEEAKDTASRANTLILIVMGIATLIGFGVAFLLSNAISRPVGAVADLAERVSKGDLTVSEVQVGTADEIGEMTQAFNKMVRDLRDMMTRIRQSSEQVATSSRGMAEAADQVAQATTQITAAVQQVAQGSADQTANAEETVATMEQLKKAIDQIAKGAQVQAQSVSQTSSVIKEMAQAIDQVAQTAQEVSDAARQALSAAEDGGKAVQQTVAGMERIRETAMEAATRVKELGAYSEQIGEIVRVIGDIADQTNLLALNAAIEAARAGEHGKGFAVVAEEVRKLAERSGRATKEIAELITTVQKGVEAAVGAMDAGTREVETGTELAHGVGNALEKILQSMRQTNVHAHNISTAAKQVAANVGDVVNSVDNVASITEANTAATEQMAASSDQVSRAIQNVASVSEETAASAEEVNASTEEVSASAEEISASAQGLASMAQDLQKMVSQFKL